MTDLPKLTGSSRALVLLLALAFTVMLAVSLMERFQNPQLTVHVQHDQPPTADADGHDIGSLMQQAAQDPGNLNVLLHLVEALIGAQNWQAAETFAQRAVTMDVNNPRPLYLLGIVKHNMGQHKEAAEALEKVLALRDDASVRYSLGVLYIYFLKDVPRGVEHLSAGLHDPKASEELKRGLRDELEKAPLPGSAPKAPAEQKDAAAQSPAAAKP